MAIIQGISFVVSYNFSFDVVLGRDIRSNRRWNLSMDFAIVDVIDRGSLLYRNMLLTWHFKACIFIFISILPKNIYVSSCWLQQWKVLYVVWCLLLCLVAILKIYSLSILYFISYSSVFISFISRFLIYHHRTKKVRKYFVEDFFNYMLDVYQFIFLKSLCKVGWTTIFTIHI